MNYLRRITCSTRNHNFPRIISTFSNLLKPTPAPAAAPAPVPSFLLEPSRSFSSTPSDVPDSPSPVDISSLVQENEFHKLADSAIHHLLEKIEEYGDNVDIDGFDIDYGNEVLTLKLGDLGTYVVNKQTPNRQIWLSSPVSGPARFDWDQSAQAWVYRRNKSSLFRILESELEKLCGEPLSLS